MKGRMIERAEIEQMDLAGAERLERSRDMARMFKAVVVGLFLGVLLVCIFRAYFMGWAGFIPTTPFTGYHGL